MTLVVPDEDENNNPEDDGFVGPYEGIGGPYGRGSWYHTMGDTYRGDSFPSSIADITWASALGKAHSEGRDITDKNVRREIFYEAFPNASEGGFEAYTTLPTDEDFKYRPQNKMPAGFKVRDSEGNVIRDFGSSTSDDIPPEERTPENNYGCPVGYVRDPVTDACVSVRGEGSGEQPGDRYDPLGQQPGPFEQEDIDAAKDRQSDIDDIRNGELDPDDMSDEDLADIGLTRDQAEDIYGELLEPDGSRDNPFTRENVEDAYFPDENWDSIKKDFEDGKDVLVCVDGICYQVNKRTHRMVESPAVGGTRATWESVTPDLPEETEQTEETNQDDTEEGGRDSGGSPGGESGDPGGEPGEEGREGEPRPDGTPPTEGTPPYGEPTDDRPYEPPVVIFRDPKPYDDIVERQLEEVIAQTTDPELRKKLEEELEAYRKAQRENPEPPEPDPTAEREYEVDDGTKPREGWEVVVVGPSEGQSIENFCSLARDRFGRNICAEWEEENGRPYDGEPITARQKMNADDIAYFCEHHGRNLPSDHHNANLCSQIEEEGVGSQTETETETETGTGTGTGTGIPRIPPSSPPTDAPPTDAPPTDAPPTDAPPTDADPNNNDSGTSDTGDGSAGTEGTGDGGEDGGTGDGGDGGDGDDAGSGDTTGSGEGGEGDGTGDGTGDGDRSGDDDGTGEGTGDGDGDGDGDGRGRGQGGQQIISIGGRAAESENEGVGDIEYFYDWATIFANPEQAKQYAEARRTVTDLLLDRLAKNRKSLDNISKTANNMLIREPLVGGIVGRGTS